MEQYYVISMKTKTGKEIYFGVDSSDKFTWVFDKNESIWFDMEQEAIRFCENYFKKFKNWNVIPINYDWENEQKIS